MPMYSVLRAIRERASELRSKSYDPYEDHTHFGTVGRELLSSIAGWISNANLLLDGNNWNSHQLTEPSGHRRKPRIFLDTTHTAKGNLVVEWAPRVENARNPDAHDFLFWTNMGAIGTRSLPRNRLIMIRGFQDFVGYCFYVEKQLPASHVLLVEAVCYHLQDVYRYLEGLFELTVRWDLYLDYEGVGHDKKLIGAEIRNTEQVNQARREVENKKWLHETFGKLGMSVETFLLTFAKAGHQYAAAAKLLREQGISVRSEKVQQLILRLYENHRTLYSSNCSNPPQGSRDEQLHRNTISPFNKLIN
jgi:hypothetical protein